MMPAPWVPAPLHNATRLALPAPARPTWQHQLRTAAIWSACVLSACIGGTCFAQAQGQAQAELGFRIITTGTLGNCVACHALPGQRDVPSTFGPTFDKVGARYDAATLRQWVSDARKIKPDTLMPPFGSTQGTNVSVRAQSMLSDEQIDHVVAALLTLR